MKEKKEDEGKRKSTYEKERETDTDPQERMRGPVSSVVQKIKEAAEENDEKEQAIHEKKQHATGGDFINE